jgi:hypothetical protein
MIYVITSDWGDLLLLIFMGSGDNLEAALRPNTVSAALLPGDITFIRREAGFIFLLSSSRATCNRRANRLH